MQTLQDFLPEIARLGNREAVRWTDGFRTSVSSYSDLYGTIGAAASWFAEKGLRKGDRVLIRAENRMEWVAVFWACVARGIQIVPVDFRFSEDLVRRIQMESTPELIVDDTTLDTIAGLPHNTAALHTAPVVPDDIVEIVYTSGTTGEPKGVVHRHRHICANLRPFQTEIDKYKKWARPFQPIRILDLMPQSHMFGQSLGIFIPVLLGGAAAFTPETHPARIIRMVQKHRISVIAAVPRILENLKNEVEREFRLPPPAQSVLMRCWRYRKIHSALGWKFWALVAGGARVSSELEEFWSRLGFLLVQGYGLTEASPVVAVNHPFNAKRGSIGKIVPGQDVVIAADGEILVRGESVTTEDSDWLHTGDLGEIDTEGRLYFRGRKKDVIVTSEGLNVYPEDVEAVLNPYPEIQDSAVVGIQRGGGEQSVHAALILADASADAAAIVKKVNERLETHQRIKSWSIWPEEDFPRTASTMKVKRREVAERLSSGNEPAAAPAISSADLGAMSSLERVELLSELENKYRVELNEEEFSELQSTKDLETWLHKISASPAVKDFRYSKPSDWARTFPVRWLRAMFQYFIAMPLFRNYLPLTVVGLEHLRDIEPPVVFVANHTSHLDAVAISTALSFRWRQCLAPAMAQDVFRAYFQPRQFSRKEVWWTGLGYFLACALFNAYPLPQEMPGTRRALNYTAELAQRGYCPLVFPEGLRSTDGKLQPFKPGIGMIATRLRIPVVPVHIEGMFGIYSVHDNWPNPGAVRVSFGKPLQFTTESFEEAAEKLREAVRNQGA